ncbi:hypothetical protein [Ruminococcus flavefaciens]|uniref:LPXTG-motif cell wall anchor domain-containing protein n=1 Tax=Ruminococcus flavefaciens TaxID=1265 RepID=A0A1K1PKP8_RUMFL|nr:hypothetical protein [Ruminococcus flavefaciens]SFW48025.1 hypothetical protein SAMN02910280_2823 [Ruminococcus flavefaciens]
MKKKYITAAFLGLLLVGAPVQMNAVSVDNSYYEQYQRAIGLIEKCSVRCSSAGKGLLEISAKTQVSGKMNEVGFKNIVVQRSSDGRNWQDEVTVGDKTAKNTKYYNLDGYAVNVRGGYYYRVVCVHYANGALYGENEVFTQTAENTASGVWVDEKPVTTTSTTPTTTTTTKVTTNTRLTTTTRVTTTVKNTGVTTSKMTTSASETMVKRATETKSAAYARTSETSTTKAAAATSTKAVGAKSVPNTGDKPPVMTFAALCSAGAAALFLRDKKNGRS